MPSPLNPNGKGYNVEVTPISCDGELVGWTWDICKAEGRYGDEGRRKLTSPQRSYDYECIAEALEFAQKTGLGPVILWDIDGSYWEIECSEREGKCWLNF